MVVNRNRHEPRNTPDKLKSSWSEFGILCGSWFPVSAFKRLALSHLLTWWRCVFTNKRYEAVRKHHELINRRRETVRKRHELINKRHETVSKRHELINTRRETVSTPAS
jgi:hypothetical protein